jgi:hypothetical protein
MNTVKPKSYLIGNDDSIVALEDEEDDDFIL